MKLIAIYNVWGDSIELLKGSIEQIRDYVDCICVVAQEKSNAGEIDKMVYPYVKYLQSLGIVDHVIYFTPYGGNLLVNETKKRQLGIDYAIKAGFTHFLHLDCDEYYHSDEFGAHKDLIEKHDYDASACRLITYYKHPTLRLKRLESYAVPFIHKLYQNTQTGRKSLYSGFRVDPSRGINTTKKTVMYGPIMHHYSYIRKDIQKKLRNSTARNNINRTDVIEEYKRAEAGTRLTALYNDTLIEVPNYFNIDVNQEIFKYPVS